MTQQKTEREKLREAIDLLRGVIQKNQGLGARVAELEAQQPTDVGSITRDRDRWRHRARLLGGVFEGATHEALPPDNDDIPGYLAKHGFANVDRLTRPSPQPRRGSSQIPNQTPATKPAGDNALEDDPAVDKVLKAIGIESAPDDNGKE